MKCPKCGKEMEEGYIRTGQPWLSWVDHKTWNNLSGEILVGGELKGAHLPAFRCEDCHMVIARY